jgi:dihydroneopterin aldolase
VNVELALDLTPAALSDDLDAGVDYSLVVRRVVEVGTGERVHLIERLAGLLCEALLREHPAREVTVTVRKVTAPLDGIAAVPGVRMTRSR